jgi:hypothetical protein
MWVVELLVNLPNPDPRTLARLSNLEVLQAKECALTFSFFVVFTFGLTIESIKELGGVSIRYKNFELRLIFICFAFVRLDGILNLG